MRTARLVALIVCIVALFACRSAQARSSIYVSSNESTAIGRNAGLHVRGYSPTWLPLACWYRPDPGSVTIATGVSNWADQSGHGQTLAQATGSLQPAYVAGALPYIQFTSDSGQILKNTTISLPQPFETIIVLMSTDGALTYVIDHGPTNNQSAIYRSAATTLTLFPQTANGTVSQSVIHSIDAVSNNSTGTISVDGAAASAGTTANTTTATGLSVGNRFDGPLNAWGGRVYEVITLSRSGAVDWRLHAYLSSRYGQAL